MTKLLIKKLKKRYSLSSPDGREKAGLLSGISSAALNILLCIAKFIVGAATGSVAITADAFNNLSDAGSGVVTIAGAKLSAKPVDREHPFGHGRIEYVSALIISFIVFIMGFELCKSSAAKIIKPEKVEYSVISLFVLIAAICVKLWIAYFNKKLFALTNNLNLKAVSRDALSDCVATAATVLSLIISKLTGFYRIDGIIGVLVAAAILVSAVGMIKEVVGRLLGQKPNERLVKEIEDIILSGENVIGVHDLIIHDYGAGRAIASAHAEVPSDAGLVEVHAVLDRIEKRIKKELGVMICIHADPVDTKDEEYRKYKQIAEKLIKSYNGQYSFHDFRLIKTDEHKNLIFDLVIPFGKNEESNKILNDIMKIFYDYDPEINVIITLEHSFI